MLRTPQLETAKETYGGQKRIGASSAQSRKNGSTRAVQRHRARQVRRYRSARGSEHPSRHPHRDRSALDQRFGFGGELSRSRSPVSIATRGRGDRSPRTSTGKTNRAHRQVLKLQGQLDALNRTAKLLIGIDSLMKSRTKITLLPGAYVEVSIQGRLLGVYRVPRSAIFKCFSLGSRPEESPEEERLVSFGARGIG